MDLWGRALLGTVGLVVFAALAVGDARSLRRVAGVPVGWVLTATAATVVGGFVHLALTPEHWEQSVPYGLFFLAAGASQLVLASVLTRPTAPTWVWTATVYANVFLVGVYVAARIGPAREEVDALGLVTVGTELIAAGAGLLAARRLAHPAPVREGR